MSERGIGQDRPQGHVGPVESSNWDSEFTADATQLVDVDPQFTAMPRVTDLGPYVIESEIGRGAMGAVYRATHTKLKRQVALKLLPVHSTVIPERLARFQREMEAIGRLDHPNIIRATDAGEFEGVHYLAMELIEGMDLQKLLWHVSRFELGSACSIARQTALGLQHVHENRLVHRDIKPSNLLLTHDGLIKILDLGIAMLREQETDVNLTSTGGLMGTPDFIAPEQLQRARKVDIRADIYSLGCALYMLLCGHPPFHGSDYDTQIAKLLAHSKAAPPPLRSILPDVPKELAKIVHKMMAKQPADRFQTPQEVADVLAPWADGAQLAQLVAVASSDAKATDNFSGGRSSTAAEHATHRPAASRTRDRRHHKAIWAVAAVACVLLCGFAAKWTKPESTKPVSITTSPAESQSPHNNVDARQARIDRTSPSGVNEVAPRFAANGAVAESLRHVAADTRKIRDDARQLASTNQDISQNTRRIANTLEELRKTFHTAARHRGLIEDPQSVGEFYHNARVCQQQGNYALARQNYHRIFQSGMEFVDVHHHYQEFLKLQEGLAGAREIYRELPGDSEAPIRAYAAALLDDAPERDRKLTTLIQRTPNFAPAVYQLSRSSSQAVLGRQTLADKAREKELIEDFLALCEQGHLLRYFLDQSVAASMISDAHERLAALGTLDSETLEQPVTLSCSKNKTGWNLVFHLAENPREIFYRLDPSGEFQSTGFLSYVNPQSGHRPPNAIVSVPVITPRQTIEVQYIDERGNRRGPYQVPFDPQAEATRDAKRKLAAFKGSWASFGRGRHRDELHFSQLALYRDAIAEVRYAVDEESPTIALGSSETRVVVPLDCRFAIVQLTYRDGTQSEIVRIERP